MDTTVDLIRLVSTKLDQAQNPSESLERETGLEPATLSLGRCALAARSHQVRGMTKGVAMDQGL